MPRRVSIQIFVKTVIGQTFSLDVYSNDIVKNDYQLKLFAANGCFESIESMYGKDCIAMLIDMVSALRQGGFPDKSIISKDEWMDHVIKYGDAWHVLNHSQKSINSSNHLIYKLNELKKSYEGHQTGYEKEWSKRNGWMSFVAKWPLVVQKNIVNDNLDNKSSKCIENPLINKFIECIPMSFFLFLTKIIYPMAPMAFYRKKK